MVKHDIPNRPQSIDKLPVASGDRVVCIWFSLQKSRFSTKDIKNQSMIRFQVES
jgi:hypothetical protein